MDNIIVNISRKKHPGQNHLTVETPYDGNLSGFFGVVSQVNYQNNTVNLLMENGRTIDNIRVASDQWVTLPLEDRKSITSKNKGLTGRRHLPPVNTYVLCVMPTGEPSSAVVICSVFACQDPGHAELRDAPEGKEEVFQYIDKVVDNGGWMFTHDIRTGTRIIQNAPGDGSETIKIEVDQEEKGKEKVTVTIHGNVFTVDKENGVDIKSDKNLNEVFKGKSTVDVTGTAEYKSANTDIKSTSPVGINGGGNNLNSGSLTPYWMTEGLNFSALQTIVTNPLFMIQMTLLDAMSGGLGQIIAFGTGMITLCASQIAADNQAMSSSAPIIK
ncbi:hypothetical protein AGMMS50268_25040 [Spirochaetia bacterium]|nr:hypothetical protein AGMMS50268_25040 [Spirochaetia bacterium]